MAKKKTDDLMDPRHISKEALRSIAQRALAADAREAADKRPPRPHVATELRERGLNGEANSLCRHLMPWAQASALGVPVEHVASIGEPSLTFQPFMRRSGQARPPLGGER